AAVERTALLLVADGDDFLHDPEEYITSFTFQAIRCFPSQRADSVIWRRALGYERSGPQSRVGRCIMKNYRRVVPARGARLMGLEGRRVAHFLRIHIFLLAFAAGSQ